MDTGRFDLIERRYRRLASTYDATRRVSERLRPEAVARLGLKPGDTVLDLGCGTGLSFELIQNYIGPEGQIIGVELSPEMLAGAREKLERKRWANVTLIQSTAEAVELSTNVDAALAFFTPEIISSPRAIKRTMEALRPGGRLVASGSKRAEGLTGIAVNIWYLFRNRSWRYFPLSYIIKRMWRGDPPYAAMQSVTPSFYIQDYMGGYMYIAWAIKEDD
ncbi:MAG: class I SAM-dependent methyltransferase [Dehalococcoidia bacterium]